MCSPPTFCSMMNHCINVLGATQWTKSSSRTVFAAHVKNCLKHSYVENYPQHDQVKISRNARGFSLHTMAPSATSFPGPFQVSPPHLSPPYPKRPWEQGCAQRRRKIVWRIDVQSLLLNRISDLLYRCMHSKLWIPPFPFFCFFRLRGPGRGP